MQFYFSLSLCFSFFLHSGGWDYESTRNALSYYDVDQGVIVPIQPDALHPSPRYAHTCVLLNDHIVVFAGKNNVRTILGDLWIGALRHSTPTAVDGIDWSSPALDSASPVPRWRHAAVSHAGQMFLFGGATADGLLSDLWTLRATSTGGLALTWQWTQLPSIAFNSVAGALYPPTTASHSLSAVADRTLLLFGGMNEVTTSAATANLFAYDVFTRQWTKFERPFDAAAWPTPRYQHVAAVFDYVVTPHMDATLRGYATDANLKALQSRLASAPLSAFATDETAATATAQSLTIQRNIATAYMSVLSARARAVQLGQFVQCLVVAGGYNQIQGEMDDLILFDTALQTWSTIESYIVTTAGAKNAATLRATATGLVSGSLLFLHGGLTDNNIELLPAPPLFLQIGAPASLSPADPFAAATSASWPWSAQKTKGTMSEAALVALAPIAFASTTAAMFELEPGLSSASPAAVTVDDVVASFAVDSVWQTIGYSAFHASFSLLGAVFVHGGVRYDGSSTAQQGPQVATTLLNGELWRMRFNATCDRVEAVADNTIGAFPGGRQRAPPGVVCATCGKGSYYNPSTGQCTLCPAGSYHTYDGAFGSCTLCPPGFFGASVGAMSAQACVACRPDSYSPAAGRSACLPCPPGFTCPIACLVPRPANASAAIAAALQVSTTLSQPLPLDTTALNAFEAYCNMLIGAGTAGAIVLISLLYAACAHCERLDLMAHFDVLYSGAHPRATMPAFVPQRKRDAWRALEVIKWQTPLGGYFFLLFVVIAGAITAVLCLPVKYNNVAEARSMAPACLDATDSSASAATASKVYPDMTFRVHLLDYGGECVTVNTTCRAEVALALTNVALLGAKSSGGAPAMTCAYTPPNPKAFTAARCLVTVRLPGVSLAGAAAVSVTLDEPLSYARFIQWQVDSDSGHPGELSSLSGYVTTDSTRCVCFWRPAAFARPRCYFYFSVVHAARFTRQCAPRSNRERHLVQGDAFRL